MKPNPDTRRLRVASVQMESRPADKEANFLTLERFVRQAAADGARLVVFPECCVSGYWFIRNLTPDALAALAEPIPEGPSTERLLALARRYQGSIGAGWVETGEAGKFHNSYVVAPPDGTFHRHRKLHAFEHPLIQSGSESGGKHGQSLSGSETAMHAGAATR